MFLNAIRNASIKWKMAVPFLLLSFIGTTSLAYIGLAYRLDLINKQERQRMNQYYIEFLSEMRDRQQFVLALASTTADNPSVQEAFAYRDRKKLIQLLYPGFLDLKYNFGIRFFHFHTLPATSFLRLHQLDKYGDKMEDYRSTIMEAAHTRERVAGLEKGALGLGIRGVAPVFFHQDLIGTLEVGYSFGQVFLENLKKRSGCNYAIYTKENGSLELLRSTQSAPVELSKETLEASFAGSTPDILISPDKAPEFSILLAPIKDYSGAKIGVIEILLDRSEIRSMLEDTFYVTLFVGIVGIVASFLCVMIVTRYFLRPIRRIVKQANQIARGERQELLEPIPTDEIGALNEAINTMLTSLKESRKQVEYHAAVLEARVQERTAELIESEEKYRTLVENVPLVVYRIRPNGEILFINHFVEELFGYTPTEIFRNSRIWSRKIYEDDRARIVSLREESFRKGKEFIAEYRVYHKEGHVVYVMDHAIPFQEADGSISSVDGIIVDVTGRIKLQERLVRSEEIKTISEVSARLAHEIRNPLVSAGGFARRLLSSMSPDDPNRTKVEIIVKEVSRLETILRMILHYIQPLELSLKPADVNDLIEASVSEAKGDEEPERGAVDLRLEPNLPEVSADQYQLKRAFVNLIKNALCQMKEGASLSVSSRLDNGLIAVSFAYTPAHISPDDVEHFFYPFAVSQISADLIDLPIAKIIVDKHGGAIEIELSGDGLLEIVITLPVKK